MKNNKSKYETREQWLAAAVLLMAPLFKKGGYEIPKVRVSCGWPSSRALSRKRRAGGECWPNSSAEDGLCQLFISPTMNKQVDVLGVLVHEVVHAVVGCDKKHGKVFRKCALSVGLEGKMTSTHAGKGLVEHIEGWVKSHLGDYPHAALKPNERPEGKQKQTTRMVKCECKQCGYSVRTSRKWLDDAGSPLCPCNKKPMSFEIPDELKGDEDDDD